VGGEGKNKKSYKSEYSNIIRKDVNILVYDIEISPMLGWHYSMWKTNILKLEKDQVLMSVAWRWINTDDPAECKTLADFKGYKDNLENDEELVKVLWDLLDKADVVIGHNSKNFDTKHANKYFLKYGLLEPTPFKEIDTLQQARKIGKFAQNKLDSLSHFFGETGKTDVKHSDIWYECFVKHDMDAWEQMKEYNIQDVLITEKLHYSLQPYYKNTGVNFALLHEDPLSCPNCGKRSSFDHKGFYKSSVGRYLRYRCGDCSHWVAARYQNWSKKEKDGSYTDIRPILKGI
jgi:DNA polymerase elongation subunit (family B)